jgi:hypothetical protein
VKMDWVNLRLREVLISIRDWAFDQGRCWPPWWCDPFMSAASHTAIQFSAR